MNKKNYEELLAENLVYYRKQAGYTQLQLAEKLNYSDKAISKWERAECAPDIFVLKQLADFYGMPLGDFLKPKQKIYVPNERKKHLLLIGLASTLVWFIVALLFSLFVCLIPSFEGSWIFLIFGLVVEAGICTFFSFKWGKAIHQTISMSFLCWFGSLCIFLCNYAFTLNIPSMWLSFILAIPIQLAIVLYYFLRTPMEIFKNRKED